LYVNCQLLPLPSAAGKEALRVGHHLHVLQKDARDHRYDRKNTYTMERNKFLLFSREKNQSPVIIILVADIGREVK